jgi:hypothetical protein
MVKLGPEHAVGFKALEGMGFEILGSNLEMVQPLALQPMPKRRFYER